MNKHKKKPRLDSVCVLALGLCFRFGRSAAALLRCDAAAAAAWALLLLGSAWVLLFSWSITLRFERRQQQRRLITIICDFQMGATLRVDCKWKLGKGGRESERVSKRERVRYINQLQFRMILAPEQVHCTCALRHTHTGTH